MTTRSNAVKERSRKATAAAATRNGTKARRQPSAPAIELRLETITPERAAELLGHNRVNRRLRSRKVQQYATDMFNGHWLVTGDTVKLDPEGEIIDGQHRLTGCVVAERSFDTWVAYNVTADAQIVTDTGAPRSMSDVLTLKGEANATNVAAILRLEAAFRVNPQMNTSQYVPSHAVLLDIFNEDPDAYREAARVGKNTSVALRYGSGSVFGFVWLQLASVDYDDAVDFFEKLKFADGLHKGDPIYALRRGLGNMERFGALADRRKVYALTVKAWNAYREGIEVQVLHFKGGGRAAEELPEPK